MRRRLWLSVPAVAAFCALLLVVAQIPAQAAKPAAHPRVNRLQSFTSDRTNGGRLAGDPQPSAGRLRTFIDGSPALRHAAVDPQIQGNEKTVQIDYPLDGDLDRRRLQQAVNEFNAQGPRLSDTIRDAINGGVLGKPLNAAPDPWIDFNGTLSVTDTGLRLSIPRGEVNAAISWWGRIIAQSVGLLSLVAIRTTCYAFFNVGSALAGPACASLASFSGAMIYQGIVIFVDGKQADPAQWGQALAGAMVAALGSAAWEGGINKFAKESMRPLYQRFSTWVIETAGRIRGEAGEALTRMGNSLRGMADDLYTYLERAFTGAGVLGTAPDTAPDASSTDAQEPDSAGTSVRVKPSSPDRRSSVRPSSGRNALKPFINRTSAQPGTLVLVPAADQRTRPTRASSAPSRGIPVLAA